METRKISIRIQKGGVPIGVPKDMRVTHMGRFYPLTHLHRFFIKGDICQRYFVVIQPVDEKSENKPCAFVGTAYDMKQLVITTILNHSNGSISMKTDGGYFYFPGRSRKVFPTFNDERILVA